MASIIYKLKLILTIQCERASELTSESFERKLLLHERLALQGHVLVCWSCRQFGKQLRLISQAFQKLHQLEKEEMASKQATRLDDAFKKHLKQLKPVSSRQAD